MSNPRFPWKKQSCPDIFRCVEYTFYILNYWVTCACREKTELPRNFSIYRIYFLHSGFLSNLRLPWKTEVSLIFSLYQTCIFYHSRVLSNACLPWKNRVALKFFNVLNILFTFRIFNNLRLPWKQFPLKFFTVLNIFFTIQDFWATLCLSWKTECALKFFTVWNILFAFRIFEKLALALKNSCPGIFHCIE